METELRPFMRVLVRDKENEAWHASLFARKTVGDKKFECVFGNWKYCIPFNGNEHFLGKSANPNEPMKIKKGQFVAARNEKQHPWRLGIYDSQVDDKIFVRTVQNEAATEFKEVVPAEMIWPQD